MGLDVLDAGCGTGLVGQNLKPIAAKLVGVDISHAMLAKAQAKGVYAELYHDDLLSYMNVHPGAYDVVASAATLIHFGDLAPAFKAAAKSLRPGGVFVMTLFPSDKDAAPYIVHPTPGLAEGGCFAHHRDYVKATAQGAGLNVVSIKDAVHEHHDGKPVPGIVVSLRR
jgi:predicted TPR repeat methyltransferase